MTTEPLKNKAEDAQEPETVPVRNVSQGFGKIGYLAAEGGVLKLYGRNGERDHLYPLDTAVKRHAWVKHAATKMFKNGINGWQEMVEIEQDMRAKILECIKQRRSMNLPMGKYPLALKFEQIYEHSDRRAPKPDGGAVDNKGIQPG